MKAITVRQPWAWAIVHGPKRVENRSWATTHRGPLLIHAAAGKVMVPPGLALPDGATVPPGPDAMEFGSLIGVVDVVGCVRRERLVGELADNAYVSGPWCWLLANPRALPTPVPYKGRLGLFEVPEEAMRGAEFPTSTWDRRIRTMPLFDPRCAIG